MSSIQFFIHQYLRVLLCRAAVNPLITQPVSMFGISPSRMQALALGLNELYKIRGVCVAESSIVLDKN